MADALAHRGPDAGGTWSDPEAGLTLGHRRLAILDLSPCGAQPMASLGGRYVAAYNGEVYNFRALRDELAAGGVAFRGHSDTEVLLAAVERWGVSGAAARAAGMFALAVWDRAERTLYLVRDRLGEKPLYYGWSGATFFFTSELKALRAHPAWRPAVDPEAVALFLRHGYVPGPRSIYAGIRKLAPGSVATLDHAAPGREPRVALYWSPAAASSVPRAASDPDAVLERLEATLAQVVGEQMASDVPLGAFLSGGIDSSLVVALMQERTARPVRTFTIGFEDARYDEAEYARRVAAHLGTEHTSLQVSERDLLDTVPLLPRVYDEPFADSSQVPTHLVARLAREHVTVALSGDGGDEVFGGYDRYGWTESAWRSLDRVPLLARRAVAGGIRAVPARGLATSVRWLGRATPRTLRSALRDDPARAGDRLRKLADLVDAPGPLTLYHRMVSLWPDPARLVPGVQEPRSIFAVDGGHGTLPLVERLMLADQRTYLPDDILVKVDRASMSVGLETRAPLLDRRVVEFAWGLPLGVKRRGGVGKWPLRALLARRVPAELFERPKQGFAVPLGAWLRGPLRDWAEALLAPDRLRADGLLDPAPIRVRWREHLDGTRHWEHSLWAVLMLQAWREAW